MEKKKISDSEGETLRVIQYADINPAGNLFGGNLMAWMDEIAGIVAIRHAGLGVTTAAVDNLQFKKSVKIGDILVLKAKLTYVGNKSMEIRVDVYREEYKTGIRQVVNRAYFTEVTVDAEGKPVEVPYGLELTTPAEQAEWEAALKRKQIHLERRQEGY